MDFFNCNKIVRVFFVPKMFKQLDTPIVSLNGARVKMLSTNLHFSSIM